MTRAEQELADRAARILKAELKPVDVTCKELARRLKEHGLEETRDSVGAKLKRGTFSATFCFTCLAALEKDDAVLDEI